VSGVDVAVAQRQDDRTSKIPILLLTVAAVLAKAETGTGALSNELRRALREMP
jgi:hypothetical protein